MASDKLARRYATALFDEAQHQGTIDTVYGDLSFLHDTFESSRELRAVFKNPIIYSTKKQHIADLLFNGKISSLTADLIRLLLHERREAFLLEVVQQFFKLYNDFKGISEVTVTTATEMDTAIEKNIEAFVRKESGKPNVKINKKIDASIGGGFIVDFGDRLYDNSVRYKLNKLKKELSFN